MNYEGKEKNYNFSSYFKHISLSFHSDFEQEHSFDVEFNYASNKYPHCMLLIELSPRKIRNAFKNVIHKSNTRLMVFPKSHYKVAPSPHFSMMNKNQPKVFPLRPHVGH